VESLPTNSDMPSSKHNWLLSLAVLLWPVNSMLIELLGLMGLNSLCPRRDFGLWASPVTVPYFYVGTVSVLVLWVYLNYRRRQVILVGLILVFGCTLIFFIWTLFSFPFGRISENW